MNKELEFITSKDIAYCVVTVGDTLLTISVPGGEDVKLFVEDGVLCATGDMDAGAKIFFDEVIKRYVIQGVAS